MFIKDALQFKDSIACPETSVRVCLGGKQSIHFSKFRKYFGVFRLFCIINCCFEYRIRIRRIWLYMGTWFKNIVGEVLEIKKMSQECEQFSHRLFVWDVWGFWVLNGPLVEPKTELEVE